jgi:hypothetical protein
MKNVTSKPELSHPAIESNSHLFDDWFDPIEDMIRGQVRGLIEEMIRGELDAALSRPRYGRRGVSVGLALMPSCPRAAAAARNSSRSSRLSRCHGPA